MADTKKQSDPASQADKAREEAQQKLGEAQSIEQEAERKRQAQEAEEAKKAQEEAPKRTESQIGADGKLHPVGEGPTDAEEFRASNKSVREVGKSKK